jgi:hypothetical protein
LTIGKEKLRWGPGYKGTLALSGIDYAPFYFYNIKLGLGKFATFSSFLCGYDDEKEFRNEITGDSGLTVINNGFKIMNFPPRYGAGQRLDMRLGRHVQVGIYELVQFFGNSDMIRYANPLQIYFLGDQTGGSNNANVCGGIDLNVLIGNNRIYGEFLNDDLTVFEQAGNPNNFGYQVGFESFLPYWLHTLGVEYVHTSRYLYTHSRALSRFTYWNNPLGWPWGNDHDYFNFHALIKPSDRFDLKAEITYAIKGSHSIDKDWYADGSPDVDFVDYWPAHGGHILSFLAAMRYRPLEWMTAEVYLRPSWVEKTAQHTINTFVVVDIPGKKELLIK